MSAAEREREVAVRGRGVPRMGFFTDTTVCIGCKACEVACKQWNDLPADAASYRRGGSYDHTGELGAASWRHVRFVEVEQPAAELDLVAAAPAATATATATACSAGSSCPTCASTARTRAASTRAPPARSSARSSGPSCSSRTSATAAGTASRRAPSASSTATTATAAPRSARSATTACRTASSPPARRRARPTRSSSGPTTSSSTARGAASRACTRTAWTAPTSTARATRPSTTSPAGWGRSSCSRSRPSASGSPRRRSRRSRSTWCPRRSPPPARARSPPPRWPRRSWCRRSTCARCSGDAPPARAERLVSVLGRLRARIGEARARRREVAPRPPGERDVTPAVGTAGGPAPWRRASEDAGVALALPAFEDARRSFLFTDDTAYAAAEDPGDEAVAAASLRMRAGGAPGTVHGPVMKPPVWTWEVPLYFWFGGIASGAAFASLACDLSGDHRSAVWARRVALGALAPSPVLLVLDLGRPERFVNMLRVVKPRSPMNIGAWALTLFGTVAAAAVGADVLGRRRTARVLGGANTVVGGYLGSYAGVLLSSTAVPVWARSDLFLGPIFVSTATATGAAATRFVLAAAGLPDPHPTRLALERAESGAIVAEALLSEVNRRRLGPLAESLEQGRAGRFFRTAQALVAAGLATRAVRLGPLREPARYAGSACFLVAGLCFRCGWMAAGPPSARDDEAVARTARARGRVRGRW